MDIKAYGKINLSLDIKGVLPDGYHSISTIMQSVELCDIVSIEKSDKISVVCDNPDIPTDGRNLAYKACELMIDEFDLKCGFDVKIQKRIPVAGGMAGGSTDAAAVLRGINEISKLNLSLARLMELGLKLGADVPFCVQQRPALAEGIGEKLTPIKGLSSDLYILLVNPNLQISTKEIYTLLDNEKKYNLLNNGLLIKALENNDVKTASMYMSNVMQNATSAICPQINSIIKTLKDSGAVSALMSGSGATCYGVFTDNDKAKNAQIKFKKYYSAITNPVE